MRVFPFAHTSGGEQTAGNVAARRQSYGHPPDWWAVGGTAALATSVAVIATMMSGVGQRSDSAKPLPVASSATGAVQPLATHVPMSPPLAPEPSPVDPDALGGLLLTQGDVSSTLQTQMTVANDESGSAPLANLTVKPRFCASAYAPATTAAYANSGFTGMAVEGLRGPDSTLFPSVLQAVATFPDEDAAKAFLSTQERIWGTCKLTVLTVDYGNGTTDKTTFGETGRDGDTINGNMSAASGSTAGCERAMTTKATVVIDVRVCQQSPDGYALSIAHAIQRNVT
jgi:serine/threonine-protein kinase